MHKLYNYIGESKRSETYLMKKSGNSTHPLESITSLEILIFFVFPLYRSSRLQTNVRSICGALLADASAPPLPPPNAVNISSPKMPPGQGAPPPRDPLVAAFPIPWPQGVKNGQEKPKNSEKSSSALRGLNRKWAAPPGNPGAPPLGGGTCPLSPSSPYSS